MQYRRFGKTNINVSVLGYGCMRFPKKNKRIDLEKTENQILTAVENGVNYFDTAYIYPGSEAALGEIIQRNNLRNKVYIATKIPSYMVNSKKSMEKVLKAQLKRLKTDYIDFYLLHSIQDTNSWEKAKRDGLVSFLEEMKEKGVIKFIGFSYHGGKDDFKEIINDYNWDFCQIQYNYIDEYTQAGIEGLKYAYSKDIGVAIMGSLKGGSIAGQMPPSIKKIWDKFPVERSYVDWAFRWLWNQEEVAVTLSGLNDESHIIENVKLADKIKVGSLTKEELDIYKEVKDEYTRLMKVPCTGCAYCLPCPVGVNIPFAFNYYNARFFFNKKSAIFKYLFFGGDVLGGRNFLASNCIHCGKCEKVCPQHIEIIKELKNVTKEMEPWWSKLLLFMGRFSLKIKRLFDGKKK
ncbi:aldo/keto reductase [Herbivorax sp. ANBcel31]|uniref:aldo/keto reductase n=1 Tax=Herbivorax sp. ANBcel31 TaxID=3069754 RepID=UPI0027B55F98|nr:aldo/keto reductase [Herbivorax sp. ANBcel31]MDQ2087461.1 aldo/keto reductase [Herbivorax sp. ANBcel31]